MTDSLISAWLDLQCRMIPGAVRGMVALQADAGDGLHPSASWPENEPVTDGLDSIARLALERRAAVTTSHGGDGSAEPVESIELDIAAPLRRDGAVHGVVAITARARPAQQEAILQVLRWGGAWLALLLDSGSPRSTTAPPALLGVLAATLRQQGFRATAIAVATELAHALDGDRGALGVRRGERVQVVALSDTATFDPRTNLVRHLVGAMEEAISQDAAVVHPPVAPAAPALAHGRLADTEGDGAILTLPVRAGETLLGAVTLERSAARPFDAQAIALAEQALQMLGPVLELRRATDRPALAKLGASLTALAGPRERSREGGRSRCSTSPRGRSRTR